YFMNNNAPSPYREALLQVKRHIEAARRGDLPAPAAPETTPAAPLATLDQPAPDFVVTDLSNQQSVRLQRCLGRPILMVFYSPASVTADEVLRFAQRLSDTNHYIKVLGLAMTEDGARAIKQRTELRLTFPLLAGNGLRQSYAVEATPKLVVLDADG